MDHTSPHIVCESTIAFLAITGIALTMLTACLCELLHQHKERNN